MQFRANLEQPPLCPPSAVALGFPLIQEFGKSVLASCPAVLQVSLDMAAGGRTISLGLNKRAWLVFTQSISTKGFVIIGGSL